jgi:HEAT repeat protein
VARTQRRGLNLFLEQLLRRGEPAIQQTALAALTLLSPQTALTLLETLLAVEGQPALQQGAVRALGAMTHPVAQRMLLRLLLEADEMMSVGVAEQLAWQGGEGWEILRDAATDEDHDVRRAASYGLAQVGEPWALLLLQGLEEDSEWIVNAAAVSALELLERERTNRSWRPARLGDQPWLVAWGARQQKVVPAGSAAEPILLELLVNGSSLEVRCAAAATLGQCARPQARRPLHQLVQQEDAPLRDAAYNALCLINRAY